MNYAKDDNHPNSPDKPDCCCDDINNFTFVEWEPFDEFDMDCTIKCGICGELDTVDINEALEAGIAPHDIMDNGKFL